MDISDSVRSFESAEIALRLLEGIADFPTELRLSAMDLLTSRSGWAEQLLGALESGEVDREDISLAHVGKLRRLSPALSTTVGRLWPTAEAGGQSAPAGEVSRVKEIIGAGGGVPKRGEAVFAERCAACHVMFEKGGSVGPDLTSYQKNDLDTMIMSLTDPSAEIREGFEQAVVKFVDGAVHTGFLAEQDDAVVTLRGLSGELRRLPRSEIDEIEIVGASLMPPGLLGGLSDDQIRDLFAYLRSTTPPF